MPSKNVRAVVSADTKKAQRAFAEFARTLTGFRSIAVTAGLALLGATKVAVDFEKQMAKVSSLLDDETRPIMEEFNRTVRDLSTGFGQSAGDIAAGLFDIISGNIEAAKALTVLDTATKGAVAGVSDVATTTKVLITILNAFKLEASDSAKVLNELLIIARLGRTDFAQVAANLGNVASNANLAKVSFEEVGALLVQITRGGISTSEAITAMNAGINAFLGPTEEAIRLAAELGFELSADTLASKGFRGALTELAKILESSDKSAAALITTLFPNIRAFKALAIAVNDTSGLIKAHKEILDKTDEFQQQFRLNSETSAQALSILKQEVVDLGRKIGGFLITPLRWVVKLLTDLINAAEIFTKRWQEAMQMMSISREGAMLRILEMLQELKDLRIGRLPVTAGLEEVFGGALKPGDVPTVPGGGTVLGVKIEDFNRFQAAFATGLADMFNTIIFDMQNFTLSFMNLWKRLLSSILDTFAENLAKSAFESSFVQKTLKGAVSQIPGVGGFLGGLFGSVAAVNSPSQVIEVTLDGNVLASALVAPQRAAILQNALGNNRRLS